MDITIARIIHLDLLIQVFKFVEKLRQEVDAKSNVSYCICVLGLLETL